jgi:hypothetical protein
VHQGPGCRSHEHFRSKSRQFVDFIYEFFGMMPLRCKICNTRFFVREAELQAEESAASHAQTAAPTASTGKLPEKVAAALPTRLVTSQHAESTPAAPSPPAEKT